MKWPKRPSFGTTILRWAGETVETLVEALQGGGLHFFSGSTITVGVAVRTIADWIPGDLTQIDLVTVLFQVTAGGPIEILAEAGVNAAPGGGNGEIQRNTLDVWKVTGRTDIVNFTAIRAVGGADADVRAEVFVHDLPPAPS